MPHILQIAAISWTGCVFAEYVNPKVPVASSAEDVTGIRYNLGSGMTVNGKAVPTVSICTALKKVIGWLSKFPHPILVAHNGRKFDFPILTSILGKLNLFDLFQGTVTGFVDSLSVFRKVYPGLACYKQQVLVQDIIGQVYAAHDAVEDVRALGKLFHHMHLSDQDFLSHSFQTSAVHHQLRYNEEKAKNITSLAPLVSQGVMKKHTADNIAGSGLCLEHLKTIYQRHGEDGLMDTFTSKNREGQPRVTNTKRTLEAVIPKLVNYFQN